MRALCSVALLSLLCLALPPTSTAQQPRFGAGLQVLGNTVDDNIGPGFRFRVSAPINQDLSFGIGSAFTGYIFQGREDASYALDPQASLIVTLPGSGQEAAYVMGGAGAYVPFGNTNEDARSGPTFHLGMGKVWLLSESSFFLEFDPALFVGQERTDVLLPIRAGVIF